MNLRQAYEGWGQQSQNLQLYLKTRQAFRQAWFTLPTNKPCSYYTKDILGNALAEPRVIESMKSQAASVMLHVLKWANFAEPDVNPNPDFTYNDLLEYTRGPLARQEAMCKPEPVRQPTSPSCNHETDLDNDTDLDIDPITALPRMKSEENEQEDNDNKQTETMEKKRGKQPKPVVQIDPERLEVIKVWPSLSMPEREIGVHNIDRAVAKKAKANGFYWCLTNDAEDFISELKQRQADSAKLTKGRPDTPAPTPPPKAKSLADLSDNELFAELERRGWLGEVSRRQVVTIGKSSNMHGIMHAE